MGNGIAHVAAAAGFSVLLVDVDEGLLRGARATIEKNLDREVAKGRRTAEDKAEALSRLAGSTHLGQLSDADLVVEAIVEDETAKKALFRQLDTVCGAETVFASNTS